MPSTTAIATNPPPRPPPSSIVEPVQRPPVLSPKVADQRQQRSGSALPPSPRHSTPTPTLSTPSPPAENGSQSSEAAQPIDMETFQQILELDEDGESYDFAWEMASAYMDQAEVTFEEMEGAIAKKDCKELSSLGHFLKGSSATLGVTKVQNSCELIQHYGDLRDNKTGKTITSDVALSKISAVLKEAKEQYKEAEIWLRNWYLKAKAEGRISEDIEGN